MTVCKMATAPDPQPVTLPSPCRYIAQEHENVYQVHRQAMAMDRGQLVLCRAIIGSYCSQPGIEPVSGGSWCFRNGDAICSNAGAYARACVVCRLACKVTLSRVQGLPCIKPQFFSG